MKALRRITGITYNNRVFNEAAIKMTVLVDLDKLHVRSRLRWYGHVNGRENDNALQSRNHVSVPGKTPAGRPKNAGSVVFNETSIHMALNPQTALIESHVQTCCPAFNSLNGIQNALI